MSDQSQLGIGKIIKEPQQRDAIHVAVLPATAAEPLKPGDRVSLEFGTAPLPLAGASGRTVGVVDPFLPYPVATGQQFWVFLFPGSISSLRHSWTHKDIPEE